MEVHVAKLAPEPIRLVYEVQVVAMMLGPGTLEVNFGGTAMEQSQYQAGDIVLCRRHADALVRSDHAMEAITFAISDRVLSEIADARHHEVELRVAPKLDDARIRALMASLNFERAAGFPSGRLFLESVEIAMAAVLVPQYALTPYSFRKYRGGLSPATLRNIAEFVHSRIDRDLSLQQMADVARLSISHFSHVFRQSVGLSPHQFVLQERVQYAKQMLCSPNPRITDIALAAGFKTQQHFARVFRRICGTSPTEYRRRCI